MGIDASQLLGSPQRAGAKVQARGFGKKAAAGSAGMYVGGAVGAVISAAREQKAGKEKAQFASDSQTPKFGRLAFLAVTDDELAVVKLKSGLVSMKLDEVLVRLPRSEIANVELGSGHTTLPLTISFQNDDVWELEVPRIAKKDAEEVVRVLSV
jgi:hypothetical protein